MRAVVGKAGEIGELSTYYPTAVHNPLDHAVAVEKIPSVL